MFLYNIRCELVAIFKYDFFPTAGYMSKRALRRFPALDLYPFRPPHPPLHREMHIRSGYVGLLYILLYYTRPHTIINYIL